MSADRGPQFSEVSEVHLLRQLIESPSRVLEDERITEYLLHVPRHRELFRTVINIWAGGGTPTRDAILAYADQRGALEKIGGPNLLDKILAVYTDAQADIKHHVDTLVGYDRLRRSREVLLAGLDRLASATPSTAADVIRGIEAKVYDLSTQKDAKGPVHIRVAMQRTFAELEHRAKQGPVPTSTGIPDLDAMVRLTPGDFSILAARPSIGKSAFAKDIAIASALNGAGALVFSVEDSELNFCIRTISAQSGVVNSTVQSVASMAREEWAKVFAAADKISGTALYIDDRASLTVDEIVSTTRRLTSEHEIKLVVVDYLQILRPPRASSRNEAISQMTWALKSMAKTLGVHVLLLSQLNREVEKRRNTDPPCLPIMSDLRDSGSIEQDADLVMFLYRRSKYDPEANEEDATVYVAKYRHGRVGAIPMRWDGARTRFLPVGSGPKWLPTSEQ